MEMNELIAAIYKESYQTRRVEGIAYHHSNGTIIDLTAITMPFGLLDEETQEALKAHGGKYQAFTGVTWIDTRPAWNLTYVYRVKPASKVETVTLYSYNGEDWSTSLYYKDNHKITYNKVDGEPDCSSIKMEKL